MDTEQRLTMAELTAQHKKSMDEARQLEPAVMVTERNWNAMLKMQHDLFQHQMQLDADLKTLLTREDAQTALNEKRSLTAILNDTKKQLSNTVQETRKKIRTCAWISITAVILCAALCALAVLWSR